MPSRKMLPLCAAAFCASTSLLHARDCAELARASLPETTITRAAVVSSGEVTPPYGGKQTKLPPFCRVEAVLRPTADSVIRFEVWMPEQGWNGRLLGTGNGGFGGSIYYGQMAGNLRRGYATAGLDAGHQADAEDASWAYRHPEKIKDFGWRAVHLETERAKALVKERYGKPADKAYFDACSDGGREALMEAQRFPEDFDGILAGAPANAWTSLVSGGLPLMKAMDANPAAFISSFKLPAITRAVLAACDAKDGLKDGILTDPRTCDWKPASIECKGEDSLECLTSPQVKVLEAIYAGAKRPDGTVLFPGLMPGDEAGGWRGWVVQSSPAPSAYAQGFFRYMVYNDPTWNPLTADVDKAATDATARMAGDLDATNADLGPFFARGGKLLLYHGWQDPAISPLNTVSYYEAVQKAVGAQKAAAGVKLYMVPGMAHCAGGPGPSAFGQLGIKGSGAEPYPALTALEQWVEKGEAPGELLATQFRPGPGEVVERTRPLCPYPQAPRWDRKGDPNQAASFGCEAPGK